MANPRTPPDAARKAQLLAELHRDLAQRQAGYRSKALNLFPHICARCGREFSGKRMKELTVHHKDFNHDNNPQDGSNWELLCIYCHDDEHGTDTMRAMGDGAATGIGPGPSPIVDPFAALGDLIKPKDDDKPAT